MTMLKSGTTNVVRYFMVRLVADGKGATGLTVTTFDLQYTRELTAAAAKIDGIVGTGGATTHVDNKVFEVGSADSPGLYMVCFPDAAFAAGVNQVTLNLTYDSTVFTEAQNIQLVAFDPFDTVRMGMTALPNAAADAAGGLVISDAGGLDTDATDANVTLILADTGELQSDDIPGTLASMDGKLDTIDNFLDTEMAAVLVDTGTTIPALIATAQADLDIITGASGVNLLTATQASIDAIEADTNELQSDDVPGLISTLDTDVAADIAALPTGVENADALLNRDMATGTDSGSVSVRTVRQALRILRNKWSVSGTTMTVTKENDTTASWTSELSTDAAADPVTGSDPAS